MVSRRFALVLFCILAMLPVQGYTAVTYDTDTVNDNADSDTTTNFNHTVGTGSNVYVGACVVTRSGSALSVSSFNIGGSAATQLSVADTTSAGGGVIRVELWGRAMGSTNGAVAINPTVSGADRFRTTAFSLFGVDQTTPTGTQNSAVGSSTSLSVNVSSAVNELVLSCAGVATSGVSNLTAGAGQTSQQLNNTDLNNTYEDITTEPGGTTVTMSESWTGGNYSGLVAIPFKAVSVVDQPVMRRSLSIPGMNSYGLGGPQP